MKKTDSPMTSGKSSALCKDKLLWSEPLMRKCVEDSNSRSHTGVEILELILKKDVLGTIKAQARDIC